LIHPIQQGFEAVEPIAPEDPVKGHPVDQRGQASCVGAIVGLAPLVTVANQAGEFENAQMLGYGGLRDARLIGQRPYGLLPVTTQPFEDCTASWVGEGLEEDVGGAEHVQPITHERLIQINNL
jgi:hypothetical protein